MKIVDVELYPISFAMQGVMTDDANAAVTDAESIIVRVLTDSSVVGLGEAAPMMQDTVLDALRECRQALIGADALNLNEIRLRLDKALPNGPPEARAAVDMAAYDLIGKVREVPVYTVLGGAYRTELESQVTLPHGSPGETADFARRYVRDGIRAVTLSVGSRAGTPGQDGERDRQTILALLDELGSDIQVNVRQSWSNAALARRFVTTLMGDILPGNLSLEQPLQHDDLLGHAELREKLPIPIVLSDSIASAEAMIQNVRLATADGVIINAGRVGGLTQARQISDICEAAAVGVSFRARTATRLGATAHAHLAATVRDPLPLDVGRHHDSEESPFSGGFDLIEGRVVLKDLPGFGVEIDEDHLRGMKP